MLILFDVTSVAFLLSLLLTPLARSLSNRLGLVDHPDRHRKWHAAPIPRVGGVAVAIAYAVSLLFIAFAPYRNNPWNISTGVSAALALTPGGVLILLIGVMDDIRGLKPWQKLIAEFAAATLAWFGGAQVHIFRGEVLNGWLSFPITILWLVGCTNALNLVDGMDGLAAGIGIFATLTTCLAALIHHNLALALVTAPLCGALLGFLRYNFNPASIFLGDSGSLLIGYLLGCFAIMWGEKSTTTVGMTAPLIALAIPLLDTSLAIIRRFLRGQPVFSADRGHIHHRLLALGHSPRRAVLLLYGFCGLAAALSLVHDVAHNELRGLVVLLFCGMVCVSVHRLGYAEFGITGRLFRRGGFRRTVATELILQEFKLSLEKSANVEEAWGHIEETGRKLGLCGVLLNLGDRVFTSDCRDFDAEPWQVRVPLGGKRFVNLIFDPQRDVQPLALTSFPKAIEAYLMGSPQTLYTTARLSDIGVRAAASAHNVV